MVINDARERKGNANERTRRHNELEFVLTYLLQRNSFILLYNCISAELVLVYMMIVHSLIILHAAAAVACLLREEDAFP